MFAYSESSAARSQSASRFFVWCSPRDRTQSRAPTGAGQGSLQWANGTGRSYLQDTGGGETYFALADVGLGLDMLLVAVLSLIVALVVGSLMGILRTDAEQDWLVR